MIEPKVKNHLPDDLFHEQFHNYQHFGHHEESRPHWHELHKELPVQGKPFNMSELQPKRVRK